MRRGAAVVPTPADVAHHPRGRWLLLRRPGHPLSARLQFLTPLRRLGLVAAGVVELHQPLQGPGQAGLAVLWNLGLALVHPRVALRQKWLGVGVLLLAQERA